MNNNEISLNSSLNKTCSMKHHTRHSFHLSETTIEEEESPPENDNMLPHLKRNTPILFSTNRGLHLRTTTNANTTATPTPHTANSTSSHNTSRASVINSSYNMTFCDLERWSTNRANTISLEDTFTIPKPPVVPSSAASGSLASNSLRFLPHKSTSVRFNGYSRFDVE
ncbi:uncharacterized protein LOC111689599 [Lucilia cuprina]|uniref:uncharacterized protein LOC111689599 n=1 Tax=Lucilia cuprina TaxID=7375 RepID=UPI001F05CD71|nr:uncharacterized protein LOC111689599 [Lucilia cuprina]